MIDFPVEGFPDRDFRITQRFNDKVDYTASGIHGALDIAPRVPGDKNVVLYAPHEGYVGVSSSPMLGNHVRVTSLPYKKDGEARESLCAHMKEIYVKNGQFVSKNEKLGLMGTTGHSTGVHVHFEYRVLKNGKWTLTDVEPYLVAWHFKS